MDYQLLKKVVRQGEGLKLEFKLKATNPERIVREAVAFANSEGGYLLVGVSDDKLIKGLKFAEEDEYVLNDAFEKYSSPLIKYQVYKIPVDAQRDVLAFHIPKSDRVHYLVENLKTKKGKAYIRVEDKSLKASYEMREILRAKKNNRNVRFRYGEKERTLMRYLEKHKVITVEEFSKTANISRKIASKTLILLVIAKVLLIKPQEMKDAFVYNDEGKLF